MTNYIEIDKPVAGGLAYLRRSDEGICITLRRFHKLLKSPHSNFKFDLELYAVKVALIPIKISTFLNFVLKVWHSSTVTPLLWIK